jgi:hypothetical protein
MAMRIMVIASFIALLTAPVAAQNRLLEDLAVQAPTQKSGTDLLACYASTATLYGGQTCEPAASLVDAVFGKCSREELEVRLAVEADSKYKDLSRTVTSRLSESVINRVHDSQRGKVQSVILDTRIGANKKCP